MIKEIGYTSAEYGFDYKTCGIWTAIQQQSPDIAMGVDTGAFDRARVESGQTVAIVGHGPLGCLLAMVARARKANVIVVGKGGWRLDRVRGLDLPRPCEAADSS